MTRADINRSGEMEVFVRIVDLGGLSAAARSLRMTPSAVSKLMSRLELRLGARLINRSTRKLQMTPEGLSFYERAVRILGEIEVAEHEAAAGATPAGHLRVNTSVPFGLHRLLPLLPEFSRQYPDISIDVSLTDTVIDLMEQRADVAIRVGPLRESRLLARKLGQSGMVVLAAPDYLARHGTPQTPAELANHNLLGFCFAKQITSWPFQDGQGGTLSISPVGNTLVSDGEAMQRLTVAGMGISRLTRFQVAPDITAGRLVPILEHYNPGDIEMFHAVFVGNGKQLPTRVRAFLDFLVAHVRL